MRPAQPDGGRDDGQRGRAQDCEQHVEGLLAGTVFDDAANVELGPHDTGDGQGRQETHEQVRARTIVDKGGQDQVWTDEPHPHPRKRAVENAQTVVPLYGPRRSVRPLVLPGRGFSRHVPWRSALKESAGCSLAPAQSNSRQAYSQVVGKATGGDNCPQRRSDLATETWGSKPKSLASLS